MGGSKSDRGNMKNFEGDPGDTEGFERNAPGMGGSKGDRGDMKNFEGEPGDTEGFEGGRGGMGGPKGEPGNSSLESIRQGK